MNPNETPGVFVSPITEADGRLEPPWNVIVLNDPINLMSYVTLVFQKLFGYPRHKAQRLMMEVHTQGRCIVWTGGREQAEFYVQQLHSYQLLAKMARAES
jgi:ATP-dependent Clp protease adaptor protein ClpS